MPFLSSGNDIRGDGNNMLQRLFVQMVLVLVVISTPFAFRQTHEQSAGLL